MDAIAVNLLPGEWLLWEGRPVRSTIFRPGDAQLVPVSLVVAFVGALPMVFCVEAVIHLGPIGAGPFTVAGLVLGPTIVYMLVGRFVVRAFTSRHTRYVVTNQRVLVMNGPASRLVTSAYLSSLPHPFVSETPDGSGSITFGPPQPVWIRGGRGISLRSFASEPSTLPVLWYVPDARRVLGLIVAAQYPEVPQIAGPPSTRTVAPPTYPATNMTWSGDVKRADVLQQVVVLLGVLGLGLAVLSATTLLREGRHVTNATVTSCTVTHFDLTNDTRVACDVTWSQDNGQHSATYADIDVAVPSPGARIPLAVRGDIVWRPDVVWAEQEKLAIGLALLAVAVGVRVLGAIRARRRQRL